VPSCADQTDEATAEVSDRVTGALHNLLIAGDWARRTATIYLGDARGQHNVLATISRLEGESYRLSVAANVDAALCILAFLAVDHIFTMSHFWFICWIS
jgi:hypothetical protein